MLIDDYLWYFHQTGDMHMVEGLTMAVRFQIDNVARYAYEAYELITEHMTFADIDKCIPNVAPLAPVMWFEFSGLGKGSGKPATNQYGCLLSIDHDEKDDPSPAHASRGLHEGTRWVLRSQCFAKLPDRHVTMNWVHFLEVTEDGKINGIGRQPSSPTAQPTTDTYLYNESMVALLAVCFAHCKGAVVQEHKPSRQVRRAAERKGEPAYSFHTIDIQPATRVLREEGEVTKNGLAKALHICRGHFAHYTAEKPLFGKYTGTFYRPMHVRGSAEQGIVGKDYRVHP